MDVSPFDKARILSEALPHMQRYDEETVVVKYGGHAMGEEAMAREFGRDIVLLEQLAINPVVVHGGGPQIGAMLEKLGIRSQFAGGLRITDAETVEVVEMVLAGSINKQLVGFINEAGGKAIGLPAIRRIDRHIGGADKEISLAAEPAAVRQRALVAQPACGVDQRPRIDVEYRLGIRLIAGFGIVAREQEQIADAERGCAHHLALQSEPVLVAAGHLQDRFDTGLQQQARARQRAHMGAGAGTVGDVDGVGQALERGGLA